MISPDVASAIPVLEQDGVLNGEQARLFGRVARGELASLNLVLQVLLYAGVLAVAGGVGLLLKDHVADLGPVTIALAVGAAGVACLGWVVRVAPAYSPGPVPSTHLALDYILLLGALLLAADLAWCEWRFTPLGANWAWHLLIVSLAYAGLALRFDSRVLFSLALTTFAAWRGVAVVSVEQALFGWAAGEFAVRLNGLACGLVFLGLGHLLVRRGIKPHFEPAATFLGWSLILLAVAGGIGSSSEAEAWLHRLALLGLGLALAARYRASDHFWLFVMGVLAAYVGFLTLTLQWVPAGPVSALFVALSAVTLLLLLLRLRRQRVRDPA